MDQTEGLHATEANWEEMMTIADNRVPSSGVNSNGFNFEVASSCRY
jgi:hypothetical protein